VVISTRSLALRMGMSTLQADRNRLRVMRSSDRLKWIFCPAAPPAPK
jgi:hypothetical protein